MRIFRNYFADSGNIFQQGSGCCIQIHTNFIYTVFYHTIQCLAQLFLVHIMLVLTYTDGLRINFYQFCQRVLQTSRYRCSTSLSHIKIRKFFCCQLAGRIYGSTGFVGDYILYRRQFLSANLQSPALILWMLYHFQRKSAEYGIF